MRGLGMPGQLIDDAALAEDRKGNLRHYDPTRCARNVRRNTLGEQRMPPVEKAVEVASSPPPDALNPYVQRCPDLPDHIQRQTVAMPPLYQGDRCMGNSGSAGHIGLTESALQPDSSDHGAESLVIHAQTLAGPTQPELMRGSTDAGRFGPAGRGRNPPGVPLIGRVGGRCRIRTCDILGVNEAL